MIPSISQHFSLSEERKRDITPRCIYNTIPYYICLNFGQAKRLGNK